MVAHLTPNLNSSEGQLATPPLNRMAQNHFTRSV